MNIRTKTLEELAYIIKDAGEAAQAMRGHNPAAEAKYLDQLADAETELARRNASEWRCCECGAITEKNGRRAGHVH